MTYRKKVDAQLAHINSLRMVIGFLIALGLYMAYGWQSAPRDLTVHVPPDLRSGSTRKWWDHSTGVGIRLRSVHFSADEPLAR